MENNIIELTQAPIIKCDAIEVIALGVSEKMKKLNLDVLEVTEDNLKEIKDTRASLNKEFKNYEEVRKNIKKAVNKPYEELEEKYKSISTQYKSADDTLKTKINQVEQMLLDNKINGIKEHFNEVNKFSFLTFEQLDLGITNSQSDKSIKEKINAKIENIKVEIKTIEGLENSKRVMAKYQETLNIVNSISQVNADIERENRIQEPQVQAPQKQPEKVVEVVEEVKQVDEEIKRMQFTVKGTISQLKALKAFMDSEGIKYE